MPPPYLHDSRDPGHYMHGGRVPYMLPHEGGWLDGYQDPYEERYGATPGAMPGAHYDGMAPEAPGMNTYGVAPTRSDATLEGVWSHA